MAVLSKMNDESVILPALEKDVGFHVYLFPCFPAIARSGQAGIVLAVTDAESGKRFTNLLSFGNSRQAYEEKRISKVEMRICLRPPICAVDAALPTGVSGKVVVA